MIYECEEMMLRPLVWGKCDCVTCAADIFLRWNGVDPIADVRGKWRTRREAERLLKQIGGWKNGVPLIFEAAGLFRGDKVGAIGITDDPSPGLAVKVAPGLWLGKSMRGMIVRDKVWGSWCLR